MKKILVGLVLMVLLASYIHSEVVYSANGIVIESVSRNFVSLEEMNRLLSSDEDYLVLDTRKPEDWIVKNIKGSVNANMDYVVTYGDYPTAIEVMKAALKGQTGSENGAGKKIILACYTGNRYAQAASNILSYLGADMSNIFTLEGGNTAWDKSEYGSEKKVDLFAGMNSLIQDYAWGDTFEYSKRFGGSNLNLAQAMDVMTITTPCAFETVALEYGLNPSFYHMELKNDNGGDEVTQNADKTFQIKFANGKIVSADTKWPANATLLQYAPKPTLSGKTALVAYSVYDGNTLMVAFNMLDKTYAKEYVESLKAMFPETIAEDYGLAPYYKGKNSAGLTASFSSEKALLLIER